MTVWRVGNHGYGHFPTQGVALEFAPPEFDEAFATIIRTGTVIRPPGQFANIIRTCVVIRPS